MTIKTILLLGCLLIPFNAVSQKLHTRDKSLPCFEKTFSIVAHIPKDTFGDIYLSEAQIQTAIDTLNVYFSPICMRFELCQINIIENFQYAAPKNTNEWAQMKMKYQQNNRINIFFVGDIPWVPYECGYADLGGLAFPQRDAIMVKTGCAVISPKTVSHEMGHFFGLLDTNERRMGGTELVDGSDCESTGDFICDTPADPYIPGDILYGKYLDVNIPCRFVFKETDANGQFYMPDIGNFMNLYPDICKCGFTNQQYLKMAEVYRGAQDTW